MFRNKNPSCIGVAKFVNYLDSSPKRAERFSRYLQQLTRTTSSYVATNYLNRNNVEESIRVIESKWKPRGTRSFKQGILAHGVSTGEYPVEKIMNFDQELLKIIFPQFPWVFVVHTNKPLLHTHFLLATTNVLTGKKFSQSPKDLQVFKDCYDDLARKYGLPMIKRRIVAQSVNYNLPILSTENDKILQNFAEDYFMEPTTVISEPRFYMIEPIAQASINNILSPIALQIRKNVEQWADMGKRRGEDLWLRNQPNWKH